MLTTIAIEYCLLKLYSTHIVHNLTCFQLYKVSLRLKGSFLKSNKTTQLIWLVSLDWKLCHDVKYTFLESKMGNERCQTGFKLSNNNVYSFNEIPEQNILQGIKNKW